jgi:hypothetical protein
MDAPTGPGVGGAGRVEPDVAPRSEPSLAREGVEETPPPRMLGVEEGAVLRGALASPGMESMPPSREGVGTGDVPGGDASPRARGDAPLGGEDVREPERERE